jgi:hypothetical protein
VYDANVPRSRWKLGLVTQLIRGTDSRARAAYVRTSGNRITSRAISRLYPMEVNAGSFSSEPHIAPKHGNIVLRRSQRSTVAETRQKIARQLGAAENVET